MMVAGDSGQALSYLLTIPASIIVMGLFGNKIFHGHVRKMIDKSERPLACPINSAVSG